MGKWGRSQYGVWVTRVRVTVCVSGSGKKGSKMDAVGPLAAPAGWSGVSHHSSTFPRVQGLFALRQFIHNPPPFHAYLIPHTVAHHTGTQRDSRDPTHCTAAATRRYRHCTAAATRGYPDHSSTPWPTHTPPHQLLLCLRLQLLQPRIPSSSVIIRLIVIYLITLRHQTATPSRRLPRPGPFPRGLGGVWLAGRRRPHLTIPPCGLKGRRPGGQCGDPPVAATAVRPQPSRV